MKNFEMVKSIISSISTIDAEEIELSDTWSNIGIDSLKLVELIVALEDNFHIKISDSDLSPQKLNDLKSIVSLVNHYLDIKENS